LDDTSQDSQLRLTVSYGMIYDSIEECASISSPIYFVQLAWGIMFLHFISKVSLSAHSPTILFFIYF
jgi:hypothetical protein